MFHFTLDPVLRLRQREEEAVQREVAEIQREIGRLEDMLRRQRQRIDSSRDELRSSLTGPLDVPDLRLHAASVVQQMRNAQRLLPQLSQLHEKLTVTRDRLVEASRRRRAIELLRESRYTAWKRDMERKAQAALDELSMRRRPSH